jgi:hypothetical protein
MYLEKSRGCGLRIGVALCRACAPHAPGSSHALSSPEKVPHPFREPLQIIVMSVISGTFPYTYRIST